MRFWPIRVGRSWTARGPTLPGVGRDLQVAVGEYELLYKYLRDRYANRVVLTFAQIEDLLGFALPAGARLHREWWAGGDSSARTSVLSDAWTLASRTGTVNLMAQIVVFDRA
jgi:hypothetical protein